MKKMPPDKWLARIYRGLLDTYGPQRCFLDYRSPLQLLVSAILSAQCTDKRVNEVGKALFKRCPDLESFLKIEKSELEQIIRSAGCFKVKASHIKGCCRMIKEEYDKRVPRTMQELVRLPGVGRKTANVILGNAFGIPGFPVDTHVIRLMNRIGIVSTRDPEKIEKVVNSHCPDIYWTEFSHLLISHGRARCTARKPDCHDCEIRRLCIQVGVRPLKNNVHIQSTTSGSGLRHSKTVQY